MGEGETMGREERNNGEREKEGNIGKRRTKKGGEKTGRKKQVEG